MLGGINPKQMQALMKQMGIKNEEIPVQRVIIECADKNIVIEPASVQKIVMQGQQTWQVAGEAREESRAERIKEEDVRLVAEKSGKNEKEALAALNEAKGDIAEAILKLNE